MSKSAKKTKTKVLYSRQKKATLKNRPKLIGKKRQPRQSKLQKVFSETKKYKIYLLLLSLVLLMSLRLFDSNNSIEKNHQTRLAYPLVAATHINLAEQYYQNGLVEETRAELQIINDSPFLLWQIRTIPSWNNKFTSLENQVKTKEKLLADIRLWENWITNNPPSRDIYLKLSQLYWQIFDQKMAQYYASESAYLDPTNDEVQRWLKSLNNTIE